MAWLRCEERVPRGHGGTAGLHPCVSMCVQACPGVSRHIQPCLAPLAMPRASWAELCAAGATQGHPPAHVQPCPRRVPPQALPGKQEAPPGNEQPRFHSNLKGPQVLPHQWTGCGISGGHPARPPALHPQPQTTAPHPLSQQPPVHYLKVTHPPPCTETPPKGCRPLTPREMGPPKPPLCPPRRHSEPVVTYKCQADRLINFPLPWAVIRWIQTSPETVNWANYSSFRF